MVGKQNLLILKVHIKSQAQNAATETHRYSYTEGMEVKSGVNTNLLIRFTNEVYKIPNQSI
jgi:hypothetical protein